MTIPKDEVFAVQIEDNCFHLGCCQNTLKESDIIQRDDVQDDLLYFCDECGELIS